MITPLPLTVRWSPTLRRGRVLFVLFAYHGRDRDDRPHGVLERRESAAVRGHRIVHRDHYANPRPLPYLLAVIGGAAEVLCDQAPDIVIDQRWDSDPSAEFAPWVTRTEMRQFLFAKFASTDVRVLGTDVPNVLNILAPELGSKLMPSESVQALARRWGWSLWATGRKAA